MGSRSLREALVILKAIGVVQAINGVGWSVMTGLFYSMPWWRTGGNYDRIFQQHKELYQAIKESNGDKAFQIMKEHIRDSWSFIKEIIAKEKERIKKLEK